MATAALAPVELSQHVCDEFACRDAVSHLSLCRCSCGGAGHGVNRGVNHHLGFVGHAITVGVRASRLAQVFVGADSEDSF